MAQVERAEVGTLSSMDSNQASPKDWVICENRGKPVAKTDVTDIGECCSAPLDRMVKTGPYMTDMGECGSAPLDRTVKTGPYDRYGECGCAPLNRMVKTGPYDRCGRVRLFTP